jgi:hypothetical protein
MFRLLLLLCVLTGLAAVSAVVVDVVAMTAASVDLEVVVEVAV